MLGALSATTPSATCAAAVAPGRPVYRRRLHRRTADSLKDGIVLRFGDGDWIDSCLYRFYVERWIKPSPPSAEDVTAGCAWAHGRMRIRMHRRRLQRIARGRADSTTTTFGRGVSIAQRHAGGRDLLQDLVPHRPQRGIQLADRLVGQSDSPDDGRAPQLIGKKIALEPNKYVPNN